MPDDKPRRQLSPRTKERRAVLAALAKAEDQLEAALARKAKAKAAFDAAAVVSRDAGAKALACEEAVVEARAEVARVLYLAPDDLDGQPRDPAVLPNEKPNQEDPE